MPSPLAVGSANSWKVQRGTRFGTGDDGMDWIEVVYRGPSSGAAAWRLQWTTGSECPVEAFDHCKLVYPPTVSEDTAYFSTAVLRFEGPSPVDGSGEDPQNAQIVYSTERATLGIVNEEGINYYVYDAQVVTATYVRSSYPQGGDYKYFARLSNLPDPWPIRWDSKSSEKVRKIPVIDDGDGNVTQPAQGEGAGMWKVKDDQTNSSFTTVTEVGETFEVTERHVKSLYSEQV